MDTTNLTARLARAGHAVTFTAKPYRGVGEKTTLRGFWTVTANIEPPLPRDGNSASMPLATCNASAATTHGATLQVADVIIARLAAIVENQRHLAEESRRIAREYMADAASYDGEAAKYDAR
jgi:hypothetical protein